MTLLDERDRPGACVSLASRRHDIAVGYEYRDTSLSLVTTARPLDRWVREGIMLLLAESLSLLLAL